MFHTHTFFNPKISTESSTMILSGNYPKRDCMNFAHGRASICMGWRKSVSLRMHSWNQCSQIFIKHITRMAMRAEPRWEIWTSIPMKTTSQTAPRKHQRNGRDLHILLPVQVPFSLAIQTTKWNIRGNSSRIGLAQLRLVCTYLTSRRASMGVSKT